MNIVRNEWVRFKLPNRKNLALVVEVYGKLVIVRELDSQSNQLAMIRETVSMSVIEKPDLSVEQLLNLPCGKDRMQREGAKRLVQINRRFKYFPKYQGQSIYFCMRCKSYHIAGVMRVPIEVWAELDKKPFMYKPEELLAEGKLRKRIWKWLRYDLDIHVSHSLFLKSLDSYKSNYSDSVASLLEDSKTYIYFLFLFLYEKRKEEKASKQPE